MPALSIIRSQQVLDQKGIFKRAGKKSLSEHQRSARFLYVAPHGTPGWLDFLFIYDRGLSVTNEHHHSQGKKGLPTLSEDNLLAMLRLLTSRTTMQDTKDGEPYRGPFMLDWPSYLVLCSMDASEIPLLRAVQGSFCACQSVEELESLRQRLRPQRVSPLPSPSSYRRPKVSQKKGRSAVSPTMEVRLQPKRSPSPPSPARSPNSSKEEDVGLQQPFAAFLLSIVGSTQYVYFTRTKCFHME